MLWFREVAPSTEPCRWYGHAPERWPEFLARYHAELAQNSAALEKLLRLMRQGPITLVFATAAPKKNNAMAFKL
ncbi:MAG: DUF488 family protein [Candidatus Bipolaricaulota bacterium]|nr:DUF488 family protein [Candidatus Bipolaricaulota bacterium]